MTDKEVLIELCKKLRLTEAEFGTVFSNEYRVEGDVVTIGAGDGYSGFYCQFTFDEAGNILDHGVWE